MKTNLIFAFLVGCILTLSLHGQTSKQPPAPAMYIAYEYKVFSLAELCGSSDEAMKKIAAIMVHTADEPVRTDLDVSDYQAAFDKLALDGWEPVTVNRSNYWVMKRAKR